MQTVTVIEHWPAFSDACLMMHGVFSQYANNKHLIQMRAITVLVLISMISVSAAGRDDSGFRLVGTNIGRGGMFASAVGPGPTEGSERYYLSYLYENNTIDVVAVDPDTGSFHVFQNPAKGECAARCMAVGPDGNVYLGTYPHGHLLKLDTKSQELIDLGMPSATAEKFIWSVTFGSDGKLYGGSAPHAKLVRYDPVSGQLKDLGRMDPVEEMARYLAASDDGFIYVGIGPSKANFAAYQIATGESREILPQESQIPGLARVFRGTDGKVYGNVGSRYFHLDGWVATAISETEAARPFYQNRLHDDRRVTAHGRALRILNPATKETVDRDFGYRGRQLKIFRICGAPDGTLYGSTELPANLLRIDPSASTVEELGALGTGEVYSLLFNGSRLLMAAYGSAAPLMAFDPTKPFQIETEPKNPQLLEFKGSDEGWRPKAMIKGADGKVYVGGDLGYGKLGGFLVAWDSDAGTVVGYRNPVHEQSVISLAAWQNQIIGGTSIVGGSGSHPTQKEAQIFFWDNGIPAKTHSLIPGPYGSINDLIVAPNGLVYGIANRELFVLDPQSRKVIERKPLPSAFQNTIYNAVGVGPDRRIWGLTSVGVFVIDTRTNEAAMIAKAPEPVTGGFVLHGRDLYLICTASVYQYTLPIQE